MDIRLDDLFLTSQQIRGRDTKSHLTAQGRCPSNGNELAACCSPAAQRAMLDEPTISTKPRPLKMRILPEKGLVVIFDDFELCV